MKKKQKPEDFEIEFFERILHHNTKYGDVIELLGGLYNQQGRLDDGLKMDRKLARLEPQNPTAHYNLACSLALKAKKPEALKALEKAVELGYDDFKWLLGDPDLKILKGYAPYEAFLATLREKIRSSKKD
ncbi:MAG: hypothetical protein B7X06_00775 [Verrucomicrobia bacterium 21-51-4]|nr:MAG: hypothetical protein B7X06_00775 [Verrucomicrobia bacterium 21-51-4]HQU08679.1 hypothetical protein [Opitutales bacterium]